MANTIYMNLILPVSTVTLGPTWSEQINTAFTAVDAHDHSNGKGSQVPSSGLNINADLDINKKSLYSALSIKFSSQSAALTGSSYASSIYVVNGNLYFTNSSGTAVQITSGGSLVAPAGTVTSFSKVSTTGDITLAPADTYVIIQVDATSAAVEVSLPLAAAVSEGRIYIIQDFASTANEHNITITPNGSDTINGESNYIIESDGEAIILLGDGASNWSIA